MFAREIFRRDCNVDILFLFGIDVLNESVFYQIVKENSPCSSFRMCSSVMSGAPLSTIISGLRALPESVLILISFVSFVISNIYQMRKLAASSLCSKLINKLLWIAVRSL